MPYNFTATEKKWQQYWLANKSFRALEPEEDIEYADLWSSRVMGN